MHISLHTLDHVLSVAHPACVCSFFLLFMLISFECAMSPAVWIQFFASFCRRTSSKPIICASGLIICATVTLCYINKLGSGA
mmetsp:Transcript_122/g.145  ORF Transcript_122/g.145 Transcript_122/m.145 type:complete len:82 (+) Transcript_122:311-556(+)